MIDTPNSSNSPAPDKFHRNGSNGLQYTEPAASRSQLSSRLHSPAPPLALPVTTVEEDDETIDLRQYLVALSRRRRIVLATFLSIVLLGFLYTSLQKSIYQATATILVSTPGGSGGSGGDSGDLLPNLIGGALQGRSLGQQMAIIQSPPVQRGALKRLTATERQEVGRFARTEIKPQREAEAIDVAVQSYQPAAAATFANAICAEYIEQSQEQNRAQVRAATRYVQDQLGTVRQRLNSAATALKEYRQRQGTIDLDTESKALITQLNQIEGDRRAAATERVGNLAQIQQLRAQIDKLAPSPRTPTVIVRTPAVETLKAKLTQLQLQRIAQLRDYKPTSRTIQDMDKQIDAINAQLSREAQTQVASWQPNPVRQAFNQDIARLQSLVWSAEARGGALNNAAQRTRVDLARLPERAYRLGQLSSDQATLQQTYQTLNEKYQTLRIQEEARVANARILAAAEAPGAPISPRRGFNFAMSVLLGLLVACGLALIVDRLDDRVHGDADVEAATGLPILAHVPVIKDQGDQLLLGHTGQTSPLLESYRMLRTNVAFAGLDRPLGSVIVTSSQPNEGKSTSAVNLAMVMAMSGKNVILVDCDLRRPSVHTLFGLPNRAGLTNIVAGLMSLEQALQETSVSGLRVLTSGPLPPNPPELLDSRSGRACLRQIVDSADFVVFDCPPALLLTDAQILATEADAALLVVSYNEANKREVARTCELVTLSGAKMLGVVLNKVTTETGGRYGYYQYQNYSSYFDVNTDASFPDGTTAPPQTELALSDGAASDGAASDGAASDGAASDGAAPDGSAPDGSERGRAKSGRR